MADKPTNTCERCGQYMTARNKNGAAFCKRCAVMPDSWLDVFLLILILGLVCFVGVMLR